jgi:hypothetical protein
MLKSIFLVSMINNIAPFVVMILLIMNFGVVNPAVQVDLSPGYQSTMSLTGYAPFDPLLIMKGPCMYLQVSWRPHTGSIGFSTKPYLNLTVQTL